MNKINNFSGYNNMIYSKNQTKNENKDNDKMEILVNKCKKVLSEIAERNVPENNKFRKIFVAFDIPKTNNEALVSISHDEIEPKNLRRVAVEVHHSNSDKFFTQYIYKGTKQEVEKFIANQDNTREILGIVEELSKRADEDFYRY